MAATPKYSEQILAARKAKGLSRAALAERSGISATWIQRIEQGFYYHRKATIPTNPSIEVLYQIAGPLGLDPAKLARAAGYTAEQIQAHDPDNARTALHSAVDKLHPNDVGTALLIIRALAEREQPGN